MVQTKNGFRFLTVMIKCALHIQNLGTFLLARHRNTENFPEPCALHLITL